MNLFRGDCRDHLAALEDSSVDSCVTDPPYELGFMGKDWDNSGIAYSVDLWREVLRVLKPGAHLLAFGGTRTYHRMAVAIEDAGFEIRDSIHWTYGTGFPKSLDVAKAIDKAAGVEFTAALADGVGVMNPDGDGGYNVTRNQLTRAGESTPDAVKWDGWGTALKPSHEPIVVARKPLEGTVAQNVLKWGTGALNIDGGRVGAQGGTLNTPTGDGNKPNQVFGTYGACETRDIPGLGRWPANTVLTHAPDCGKECVEGCPVRDLDEQSGFGRSRQGEPRAGASGDGWGMVNTGAEYADEGGASRFFAQSRYDEADWPVMLYVAKASQSERLGEHPTVKPVALMRQLICLVTPPRGLVLDPFLGSGSTAAAAVLEGMDWCGAEMTSDYWQLIEYRVAWANDQMANRLFIINHEGEMQERAAVDG